MSLYGSATWGAWTIGEEQTVSVRPEVVETPPALIRQVVVSCAEPCTVPASAATELVMTLQPVSVRFAVPENSAALDAAVSSARMQALAAVLKLATAREFAV